MYQSRNMVIFLYNNIFKSALKIKETKIIKSYLKNIIEKKLKKIKNAK